MTPAGEARVNQAGRLGPTTHEPASANGPAPPPPAPLEIALSAAWHAGYFGNTLQTVSGESIEVVHRGAWSHGLGPDFQDALILFGGRELRSGSVEIHLRGRGWSEHGHHLDPAYDTVILHVVGHHDGAVARRSDGAIVPVVELGPVEQVPIPDFANWSWDRVGGRLCAERIAACDPGMLRGILMRLGDTRLAARSARIEARLPGEPPGEILWQELLDGFGYSANREPMRRLAQMVRLGSLEAVLLSLPAAERLPAARGILLGTAGFLPLSPSESHLGGLSSHALSQVEAAWLDHGAPWHGAQHAPTAWQRARVRPANHPVIRLLAASALMANACALGGLVAAIVEIMHGEIDPVDPFRDLTGTPDSARIGADRALDMLTSCVIPFALAFAAHTDDRGLAEGASRQWDRLPAPAPNAVTRRAAQQVAGSTRLGKIGARGSQGLIHLDTTLCQPRRCFECPIAAAELAVKDA